MEFPWNEKSFKAETIRNGQKIPIEVCHKDIIQNPKDFMVDNSITFAVCYVLSSLMSIEEARYKVGKDKPQNDVQKVSINAPTSTSASFMEKYEKILILLKEREALVTIRSNLMSIIPSGLPDAMRDSIVDLLGNALNERLEEIDRV
jgi:hypothetical protein